MKTNPGEGLSFSGDSPPTKTCLKCKRTNPIDQFSKNRTSKDGLQRWCKLCTAEYDYAHRGTPTTREEPVKLRSYLHPYGRTPVKPLDSQSEPAELGVDEISRRSARRAIAELERGDTELDLVAMLELKRPLLDEQAKERQLNGRKVVKPPDPPQPEFEPVTPRSDAADTFRVRARKLMPVDENAEVRTYNQGAYVQAWLWVNNEE